MSKILEMAVKNRLLTFLNQSNFFVPQQYGFRKKMNTQLAAVDMIVKIQSALDRGMIAGLFIDLSKAFDTINHELLFKKINEGWYTRSCTKVV